LPPLLYVGVVVIAAFGQYPGRVVGLVLEFVGTTFAPVGELPQVVRVAVLVVVVAGHGGVLRFGLADRLVEGDPQGVAADLRVADDDLPGRHAAVDPGAADRGHGATSGRRDGVVQVPPQPVHVHNWTGPAGPLVSPTHTADRAPWHGSVCARMPASR